MEWTAQEEQGLGHWNTGASLAVIDEQCDSWFLHAKLMP
jgi:hypothetical protein